MSAPSTSGVHWTALGTAVSGLRASRATVLALSNPTYDVMAISNAKATVELVQGGSSSTRGCCSVCHDWTKATTSTAEATTIANASTTRVIREDTWTPRIIRASAKPPTTT